MKLKNLIANLDIVSLSADPEIEITGITYDSRAVKPGDAFVAVRGFETDGHRYIPSALDKGAAVIICQDEQSKEVPYVAVKDSRLALAFASAAFYAFPSKEMKVVGVTGTSGKTTTTHLIKHILESQTGAKVGLIGTNGNLIGSEELHTEHTTPESCDLQKLFRRMADAGCKYAVMEVSSHSLTLDRVAGIEYAAAAFTNLSQDHLDFHGTMEQYAAAKRKLFSMTRFACVNTDDAWSEFMLEGVSCPLITSSAEREADLMAYDIALSASGVHFTAEYACEKAAVSLAIPGIFSVHNALTAISVCLALGLTLSQCAAGLSTAKGVKGRVETVPVDGDYTVIIDYSHKPDALENVLKTLRPVTKGALTVLFGCGGDRDRKKRPIMGHVAAQYADKVIITSDNPRTESPEAIIAEIAEGVKGSDTPVKIITDRIEAIHWAIDNACPGDVLLLAGKGHEDYQVIGHEKHHMDEREIVSEYLREKRS